MKYSQFLQLTELLEKNSLSLDDWDGSKLNEEDEEPKELDTKKGNILTRRGRQRSALNKHAKRLQEQINKDVADKFLKPIFDLKGQLYKKMAEMGKGKQPKEILDALRGDLKNVQGIQKKQLDLMEKHAQSAINKMTEQIDSSIEKGKLKDTTKANLKTYWSLLTTQIMMNLLQKIASKDENLISEIIQDEGILKAAKAINRSVNKELEAKKAEKAQSAAERKKQVQAEDQAAARGDKEEEAESEEGKE